MSLVCTVPRLSFNLLVDDARPLRLCCVSSHRLLFNVSLRFHWQTEALVRFLALTRYPFAHSYLDLSHLPVDCHTRVGKRRNKCENIMFPCASSRHCAHTCVVILFGPDWSQFLGSLEIFKSRNDRLSFKSIDRSTTQSLTQHQR